jgi:MoaA/NifB/PqqE/SkfB family radical SAM enzyme
MSGGEPFLRADLPEICEAAVTHCHPSIINVPSNGLLPEVVEGSVKRIVEMLEARGGTTLIVNLSLDGLGSEHDKIRGVKGNFDSLIDTYGRLEKLRNAHSCLKLGIHSVVSKFNVDSLSELYDFVRTLGPDSYITEIAEERSELFNIGNDIQPATEEYTKFVKELSRKVRNDFGSLGTISKVTQSYRTAYYDIVTRWLKERRQIIPCYAAYASCQITSIGDVWPCCVLGYEKPLGNLRETKYDLRAIWLSERAEEVRSVIKNGGCSCPLANAHYTNMLCNLSLTARLLKQMLTWAQ